VKSASRLGLRAGAAVAAIPVVLARTSAPALAAGAVLVVFIVVLGICWTIADARRAERLAMLISAARTFSRQPKRSGELPPK
jgi:hypothetical protein